MTNKEAIRELFELQFSSQLFKDEKEAIQVAMDALKQKELWHGCGGCRFEALYEGFSPCCDCRHNHIDYWTPKEQPKPPAQIGCFNCKTKEECAFKKDEDFCCENWSDNNE